MKRNLKNDISEHLDYSAAEERVIYQPYYAQISDEDFFTKAMELAKEVANCESDFNIFYAYYTTNKTNRSLKEEYGSTDYKFNQLMRTIKRRIYRCLSDEQYQKELDYREELFLASTEIKPEWCRSVKAFIFKALRTQHSNINLYINWLNNISEDEIRQEIVKFYRNQPTVRKYPNVDKYDYHRYLCYFTRGVPIQPPHELQNPKLGKIIDSLHEEFFEVKIKQLQKQSSQKPLKELVTLCFYLESIMNNSLLLND